MMSEPLHDVTASMETLVEDSARVSEILLRRAVHSVNKVLAEEVGEGETAPPSLLLSALVHAAALDNHAALTKAGAQDIRNAIIEGLTEVANAIRELAEPNS